jgi:hypothetical protein
LNVKVLGKLEDLRRLDGLEDFDHLDIHDSRWTPEINSSWLLQGIRDGQPFRALSDAAPGSTFHWELEVLRAAGYVRRRSLVFPEGEGVYVPKAGAELGPFLDLAPYIVGVPVWAPVSAALLLLTRAVPVHILGVVREPAWADGQWCSPEEYFYHDLDHARFKIREDLLALGYHCPDAYQPIDGGQTSTLDPHTGQHRVILSNVHDSIEEWGSRLWKLAKRRLELAQSLITDLATLTDRDALLGRTAELLLLEIVHEKSFPMDAAVLHRELANDCHLAKIRRKLASGFYGPDGPDVGIGQRLDDARDWLSTAVDRA